MNESIYNLNILYNDEKVKKGIDDIIISENDMKKLTSEVNELKQMIVELHKVIAIQNANYKATDSLYEEKMATAIVMSWKQSSGHNKIITDPQMKFFGVSSQIEKSNPDLKTWNHFDICVVMVLVDNK